MLSLVFGKTTPVYSPGELLSGDVVFNTPEQSNILDLTVNFCGLSTVSFLVSEGKGKSRSCQDVEETDIHLDVLHPLIKSYRGVRMEAGVHTYSFTLKLPKLLPSSYKSPYGQIDYYIHAHLQTSDGTLDVRKPYYIIAPVNINLFTACQNPKSVEVSKKYGIVSSKMLRLKASVAMTGFVPGDVIPVFVEICNETSQQLRYLFCTLKQVTNVQVQLEDNTVNRVTKQCLRTVAHKLTEGGGGGHYSWLCQLPSPSQLTPTIAASTIVFVTYTIQVSAKLKRVPIPPEVNIPIVFGVRAPIPTQRMSIQSQPSGVNPRRRFSSQPHPRIHNSAHCSTSYLTPVVENLSDQNSSESTPTATNPRRRVTVSSQPQLSFTNPTRRFSQWQSVASNLSQQLGSQLQLSIASTLRRLSFSKA